MDYNAFLNLFASSTPDSKALLKDGYKALDAKGAPQDAGVGQLPGADSNLGDPKFQQNMTTAYDQWKNKKALEQASNGGARSFLGGGAQYITNAGF